MSIIREWKRSSGPFCLTSAYDDNEITWSVGNLNLPGLKLILHKDQLVPEDPVAKRSGREVGNSDEQQSAAEG